jgi:hypothetical protein
MDDIIILIHTKSQFFRAKKRIQKILLALKLELSPHKSKMGPLNTGFHFLGVDFTVQTLESRRQEGAATQIQPSKIHVSATLHPRSCARALDKIVVMGEDAVHPAHAQRYLSRWAAWWVKGSEGRIKCGLSQSMGSNGPEEATLTFGLEKDCSFKRNSPLRWARGLTISRHESAQQRLALLAS